MIHPRLRQVDRTAYKWERQQLQTILTEAWDQHRFRHKRGLVPPEPELEWAATVEAASQLPKAEASEKDKHQPTNLPSIMPPYAISAVAVLDHALVHGPFWV
jgi:hypothetical protein